MAELYRTLSRELNEIRLLVIEPGAEEDPVRCRLRHINLRREPAPPYETVSYVWGNPKITATIYLGGEPWQVPASSERVLRRFRQRHVQRIIWLDAVCINQEDRIERGEQVSFMHSIYGNGRCNLVWLGEDDGSTERALRAIDTVVNEISDETDDFANFFDMLYQRNGAEKYSDTGLSVDIDWEPLLAFFASPWLRRLWIVQEASLARHSVCYRGSLEVPLEHVLKVAQWLRYKRFHLPFDLASQPGMHHTSFIADFMEKHYGFINTNNPEAARIRFSTLLGWLRPFYASEPKDHVYALLGLFMKIRGGEMPGTLTPDYSSPLSATYTAAARFAIEDRNDLKILRYVFHQQYEKNSDLPDMPSWVPRWNWQWDGRYDPNDLGVFFKACGEEDKIVPEAEVEDPSNLEVKGISVGTAEAVLGLASREILTDVQKLLALLHDAESLLQKVRDDGQANDPQTTLAMTLAAGRDWNRRPFSPVADALEGLSAFKSYLTAHNTTPPAMSTCNDDTPEQEKLASRYHQALLVGLENRHFFTTSSGLVGAGPPTMEQGDMVVLLISLQVPIVLRPHSSNGSSYHEYIGECYVHGFMFGEGLQRHRTDGKPIESFLLR